MSDTGEPSSTFPSLPVDAINERSAYTDTSRHCANKLHRLRQVTGLTNGKGKQFKKAPAVTAETATDVR